jgi:hypothetical protein
MIGVRVILVKLGFSYWKSEVREYVRLESQDRHGAIGSIQELWFGSEFRSYDRDQGLGSEARLGSDDSCGSERWTGRHGLCQKSGMSDLHPHVPACSVCPAHREPCAAGAPALAFYPHHRAAAQAGRKGGVRGGAAASGGQG